MDSDEVLSRLRQVWSTDHGLRLLAAICTELSKDLPQRLRNEAAGLRAAGDALGGVEADLWASRAGALLTRNDMLTHPPAEGDDIEALLSLRAQQFDDAWFELGFDVVASSIGQLDPGAGQPTDLVIMELTARAAGREDRIAEAKLYEGTRQLLITQSERVDQPGRDQARRAAGIMLEACAADERADPAVRARAESNLAVLAGAEHPDIVERHQTRAIQLAATASDPGLLRRLRRDRAWWMRKAGDADGALTLLRANLDASDREIWACRSPIGVQPIVADMTPDIDEAIDICLEQGPSDPVWFERALEYAERVKARPFMRAVSIIARRLGPIPPRLTERRALLRQGVRRIGAETAAAGQLDRTLEQRAAEVMAALERVEAEIETVATKAIGIDTQSRPLSYAEMLRVVPTGTAILSYYVLRDRVIGFLLTPDGLKTPPINLPIAEDQLAKLKVTLTFAITSRGDYGFADDIQAALGTKLASLWPEDSSRTLHAALIAPFIADLATLSQVWICAHGTLLGLPFHVLEDDAGELLNDVVPIAYTPGIAALAQNQRSSRRNRTTMFAAGTDVAGEVRQGTSAEAAAVAALWDTVASKARVDAIRTSGVQADILHLACHSDRLNDFTSLQGLSLEDGTLSAMEIANLPLSASLATLSACESGSGDLLAGTGTEMAGIVGAFMRAGVPSVVATLWPLDDRMAVPLMAAFYTQLRQPGVSVAAALAKAAKQVRLASPEPFQHPYFWAPFCVWGDAKPLEEADGV